MSFALFLGVDGGGTTSRARLVDEAGRVLGEGVGGSSNLTTLGQRAVTGILEAAEAAMAAASLSEAQRADVHAGLGLAGANIPSLADAIRATPLPFASVEVASDAVAACLGAHGGEDGAILIVGTGTQGLVLEKGVATTVGGWGFALSDDGSGAILGRAAIRAAMLAVEGLAPGSEMTAAVMAQFGRDPATAVVWSRTATPRDYGSFAPLVFEHAARGDAVALDIVRASAAALATMRPE